MEQLEQLKIGKRNLQVKLGKLFNKKTLLELAIRTRHDEELLLDRDKIEQEMSQIKDEIESYNEQIEIAYKTKYPRRKVN